MSVRNFLFHQEVFKNPSKRDKPRQFGRIRGKSASRTEFGKVQGTEYKIGTVSEKTGRVW